MNNGVINMLPKKGRRQITVNNVLYYYTISGSVSVVIQNSITNEIIKWHAEWKPKWKMSLTPANIKMIIEDNNS